MPEDGCMAITATSTLAEIRAEYLGNVGYSDVTGAAAFAAACRALLVMLPNRSMSGSKQAEFDVRLIEKQLAGAERYVIVNRDPVNGGGNRAFDLSGSRI